MYIAYLSIKTFAGSANPLGPYYVSTCSRPLDHVIRPDVTCLPGSNNNLVNALVDHTNDREASIRSIATMFIHFFNLLDNCSGLETHWRGHILYYLAYNRTESAFSNEQH